jgi:hypothetical protein
VGVDVQCDGTGTATYIPTNYDLDTLLFSVFYIFYLFIIYYSIYIEMNYKNHLLTKMEIEKREGKIIIFRENKRGGR